MADAKTTFLMWSGKNPAQFHIVMTSKPRTIFETTFIEVNNN